MTLFNNIATLFTSAFDTFLGEPEGIVYKQGDQTQAGVSAIYTDKANVIDDMGETNFITSQPAFDFNNGELNLTPKTSDIITRSSGEKYEVVSTPIIDGDCGFCLLVMKK